MRGVDLALGSETAARIAGVPRTRGDELLVPGAESPTPSKLRPVPGGRAIVDDLVTTMHVARDGSVTLDDKPDIEVKFELPIPRFDLEGMRQDLGKTLTDWYRDPEAGKRFGRTQDVPRHVDAVPGVCDSWASLMCEDPLAPGSEKRARKRRNSTGGIGGKLDITGYLHRKFVGDPFASRKLELLDSTRDQRIAMGERHRADQQARSAELVQRNLERLWRSVTDPVARKAALFELWDECSADEAGARARAMVIGWIRARLPADTTAAYTADEIAKLDAVRTSPEPFVPYEER